MGTRELGWTDGAPIPGTPFREVVTATQTRGALDILAADMPVGEHVPEHCHDDADQITIVLEGTVGALVDGEHLTLHAGATALLPRGVAHAQWNAGDIAARVLEIYTPSGFEEMARTVGGAGGPSAPSPAR